MFYFLQYENDTNIINWVFAKSGPLVIDVADENCTIIEVDFYNENLLDCYYKDGKYFTDAEFTNEIVNYKEYVKPIEEIIEE